MITAILLSMEKLLITIFKKWSIQIDDNDVTPTYTGTWRPEPAEVRLVLSSNVGREPLVVTMMFLVMNI